MNRNEYKRNRKCVLTRQTAFNIGQREFFLQTAVRVIDRRVIGKKNTNNYLNFGIVSFL